MFAFARLLIHHFRTLSASLAALFVVGACATGGAAVSSAVQSEIRSIWLSLPESRSNCRSFDYFPDGGLRNFACHVGEQGRLDELADAAGMPVFRAGPHEGGFLDLDNDRDFGRYNPDFVRWLSEAALPAADDEAFRRRTQPIWDRFVAPLARVHLATYRKWEREPELLRSERERYEAMLNGEGVPPYDYERYFYFLNSGFADNPEGGYDYFSDRGFDGGRFDGNVIKTAAAFWLRRHIDGTADEFYTGLKRAFAIYEPEALRDY